MFLSISILAILIVSATVLYLVQNKYLRLLPRDFDSPASLLAAVYASGRLKNWAERQHQMESTVLPKKGRQWGRDRKDYIDNDTLVSMGHFKDQDGREHWGIEVVDESSDALNRPR